MYKQHDAEEFQGHFLNNVLGRTLKTSECLPDLAGGGEENVVHSIFGIELEKRLTCVETDDEPVVVKREKSLKLSVNIRGGAGSSEKVR